MQWLPGAAPWRVSAQGCLVGDLFLTVCSHLQREHDSGSKQLLVSPASLAWPASGCQGCHSDWQVSPRAARSPTCRAQSYSHKAWSPEEGWARCTLSTTGPFRRSRRKKCRRADSLVTERYEHPSHPWSTFPSSSSGHCGFDCPGEAQMGSHTRLPGHPCQQGGDGYLARRSRGTCRAV